MRLFKKTAIGILLTFMSILVLVTIVAHSRKSGSTRQDMSQAHLVRENALQDKS